MMLAKKEDMNVEKEKQSDLVIDKSLGNAFPILLVDYEAGCQVRAQALTSK